MDAASPLAWFLSWTANEADGRLAKGWQVRLKIMAHGVPGAVQFCKEWLSHWTVGQMSLLQGKLTGGIELHACEVARIGSSSSYNADGNMLCCRMAQITQTTVKASTAVQWYNPDKNHQIDFGQWEGTVLTYGPKGNVLYVQHYPAQ